MSDHIVVVVPIKAAPGKGDEIVAAFTPCIEATVQEEGCISYALNRNMSDPDDLVHIEVWRSQADLDEHFVKPYMADLMGAMGTPGLLAERPSITMYRAEGVGGPKGSL